MAITTKRRFTDEFKREAVALWETSGRMQTEVAAELGIMPTMLRRWQRKLQESSASPTSPAAKPPVPTMASSADQASGIARLRRELDRARMERDILKKAVGIPSTSLRTGFAQMPRWPRCSAWRPARSWVGRCATTCAPNCRSRS